MTWKAPVTCNFWTSVRLLVCEGQRSTDDVLAAREEGIQQTSADVWQVKLTISLTRNLGPLFFEYSV